MESGQKVAICGCCAVLAVIGVIVFASFAFETIAPIEYGIIYNNLSKRIDGSKVYEGGWHYTGITSSFLKFPATIQNVEFTSYKGAESAPLEARTQEGLTITMDLSFQYKLVKDKVGDLYNNFTDKYEDSFIRIARGALIEESAKHNSAEYWENRKVIGQQMKNIINERLETAHATCESIQILSVELPEKREAAIIKSQVEKQINQQKLYEQEATEVRAAINVDVSETNQKITVIEGNA
jgi:hypothetical protein